VTIEAFGQTADGKTVHRIRLTGGGLTARIMNWGATLQDLRLEGHAAPLTLGFNDFASYPAHSPYFGQTPGRHANRIARGRFRLDGM
jgi:aldose 1-epimerase